VTLSRSPFSYAVVRVVPNIEREEFLNAGLILFSRPHRFILARTHLDETRLRDLAANGDVEGVRGQLDLFERIAAGDAGAGPIARLSPSERFHWLTAPRSTAVQPGPIHTGVTDDPRATFEHLFAVLVAR
jgi:hypothetical protein